MQQQPVGWSDIKMGTFPTVAMDGWSGGDGRMELVKIQIPVATTTGAHSLPENNNTTITTKIGHAQRDV